MCYVPLVCSIVISVYCQSDGQLPTTLTELYENFILQTVRRHVEKRVDDTKPVQVYSLHHLPSVLDTTFKEICHFAYLSLKENNPKMTFSSFQLSQSLGQSEKEGYLGLMTTFIVGIEERYQFLHLSIQEFLAAWWIAKYEKTEEVFLEHFDNDHFRMCLMFVAGLTHLEDESYQLTKNLTYNVKGDHCLDLRSVTTLISDRIQKLLGHTFILLSLMNGMPLSFNCYMNHRTSNYVKHYHNL